MLNFEINGKNTTCHASGTHKAMLTEAIVLETELSCVMSWDSMWWMRQIWRPTVFVDAEPAGPMMRIPFGRQEIRNGKRLLWTVRQDCMKEIRTVPVW